MPIGGSKNLSKNGKKSMPNYLFDELSLISESIENSDNILLLLDYDGTLVSFKSRPGDVETPEHVKEILNQLCKNQKFSVFIITGRTLEEIKNLIKLNGVNYAAIHGFIVEFSSGKKKYWNPLLSDQKLIEKICKDAQSLFNKESGVLIEDKNFTVAFHYRMVPKDSKTELTEKFLNLVKKIDISKRLDLLIGEEVIEVRPPNRNKGKSVEFILDEFDSNDNILPIYIGDGTTDEDAFRYLSNKGITIFVKNNDCRETKAKYWVDNPKKVFDFLKSLYMFAIEKKPFIKQ
jgi:trehalose-phosphatase